MIDKFKLAEFICQLDWLTELADQNKELTLLQNIDIRYYKQSRARLRDLLAQRESIQRVLGQLQNEIDFEFENAHKQWCCEVRWLNPRDREREQPVL
ncbi:hypothetical protein WSM22_37610 [Cytophagales bacterium WSM2-2]|nr:hypothetical protein WSM22_37610 [Cytophagales bacterium WSM2-2]